MFCGEMTVLQPNEEREMNLGSHLNELRKKHETLSQKIEMEQKSPGVDDLVIAGLKKEKLLLKEEIERVAARI